MYLHLNIIPRTLYQSFSSVYKIRVYDYKEQDALITNELKVIIIYD